MKIFLTYVAIAIIVIISLSNVNRVNAQNAFSIEMCQEVNLIRAKYGLRPLSHSPAMQYTAESHIENLVTNNFPIFQGDPCDGHSWFDDPTKGISYCCSQGGCMGDKASLLTRNWATYGGFQYTGVSLENYYAISQSGGFFGGTITTSGVTARRAVLSWEQSSGHNRTMNGAYAVCGGAMNDARIDVSANYYTYDGIALLWVGSINDSNIGRISKPWPQGSTPHPSSMPSVNPTRMPTKQPTTNPTLQNPTPNPTLQNPTLSPPSLSPTQSNVVVSKCPMLENYCWAKCGAPDIFSFLENCGATRDGGIISCKTPVGCSCDVPDIYKTQLPASWGIVSPSMCETSVCNVNWNTLIPGSIKWCQACANNCSGYQNDCINNGDFCRYNCANMQMCSRWRQRQCNMGDIEMCPAIAETPNPTSNPTYQPTPNPSSNPTPNPTLYPSKNPTPNPTLPPTQSPTLNPSQNPTSYPSQNPTFEPSPNPTFAPSPIPTVPDMESSNVYSSGYTWSLVAVFFLMGIGCLLILLIAIGYKFKWYQYFQQKKSNEIEMVPLVSAKSIDQSRIYRDNKFDEIADSLQIYDKIQVMTEILKQNTSQNDITLHESVDDINITISVTQTHSTISITQVRVTSDINDNTNTGNASASDINDNTINIANDENTVIESDIILSGNNARERRRHHKRRHHLSVDIDQQIEVNDIENNADNDTEK